MITPALPGWDDGCRNNIISCGKLYPFWWVFFLLSVLTLRCYTCQGENDVICKTETVCPESAQYCRTTQKGICLLSCSWSNTYTHIFWKIIIPRRARWFSNCICLVSFLYLDDQIFWSCEEFCAEDNFHNLLQRECVLGLKYSSHSLSLSDEWNTMIKEIQWMWCDLFFFPNWIYQNHTHLILTNFILILAVLNCTLYYNHVFSSIFVFLNEWVEAGPTHPHPLNPSPSDLVGHTKSLVLCGSL